MADANVIRDFFVALGFKTNDVEASKMQSTLLSTEAKAKLLNKALVGLAAGAVYSVAKTAKELDKLYYSSQRVGASASNIQAYGDAISQMGGDAESAVASLESVAQKIRNSPGYEDLIKGLGVVTRDQNGQMRDRVEVFKDLSQTLSTMPYYQANAYAQSLGIDEKTMMAMRDGSFLGNMEKYQKLRKDMGMTDELAESGKDFMVESRELGMTIKGVSEVLLMTLGKTLIPILKLVNTGVQGTIRWFSELDPAIKNVLTAGMKIAFLTLIFNGLFRTLILFGRAALFFSGFIRSLAVLRYAALASIFVFKKLGGILLWLMKVLAFTPIGRAIALIGLLVAGIRFLIKDFEKWKEGSDSLFDWSKWTGGIDKIIGKIKDFLSIIDKIKDKVINFVKKVIDDPAAAIEDVAVVAKDAIVEAANKAAEVIQDSDLIDKAKDIGGAVIEGGKQAVEWVGDKIDDLIGVDQIKPSTPYPTHTKQALPKTSGDLAEAQDKPLISTALNNYVAQSVGLITSVAKASNNAVKGVVVESNGSNDVVFDAMKRYGITEKNDVIGFLSNIEHEVGSRKSLIENTNHSWKSFSALAPHINNVKKWIGRHGKNAEKEFKKLSQPELVEIMYGNRSNLGNNQAGDGWKFRGRGYMQLTGRANYQKFADSMGRQDIMDNPDLIATDKELAANASAWFWKKYSQASKNAMKGDFIKARQISNGGNIGMKSYKRILEDYQNGRGKYKQALISKTNHSAFAPLAITNSVSGPPLNNPEKSQVNSSSNMVASNITIHQSFKTDMNIHGAREPIESANAVKHNQENSLIVMARNAKSLLA